MIKAMEFIVRQINDEDVFVPWLSVGVADGDIKYGDLNATPEDEENLDFWLDDEEFRGLMECFLRRMKGAIRSGGLFCNYVCGSIEKPEE